MNNAVKDVKVWDDLLKILWKLEIRVDRTWYVGDVNRFTYRLRKQA